MELDIKKDKEGANICTLKDGRDVGASLNLDKLFNMLGDDFTDRGFEYNLARIGLRHATMGLDCMTYEGQKDELFGDLCFIETIIDAFDSSISRADIYSFFRMTEENYKTDLLGAKKDLKEVQEAFCDARNTIEEYLSKNMNLQNENDALKDKITCLKQKIMELENVKVSNEENIKS